MSERQEVYRTSKRFRTRTSEHAEQSALMQWARLHEERWPELRYFFAIPNGAMRSREQAVWFKAEGLKKGAPDTCLPVPRGPYAGLYIEMKTERGDPSPDQLEWLEFLNSQGYLAALAFGFDQAVDTLTHYLNLPRPERV